MVEATLHKLCADEVHLRATDEAGHEEVAGVLVQLQRRAHLLDAPGGQHDDAVGQGHGLHLVVRHVDHGGLELLVQLGELHAHLHAQGGVQVGQRLVEKKDLGLAHDGPADGHALALAAREVLGLALQQVLDVQDPGGLLHRGVDLRLGHLGQLQPERHVVVQVHVRVQRVALEHHRNAALGRRHVVDHAPANAQFTARDVLQASNGAQQRTLAAARGADEDHELAVAHFQIDVTQHMGLAIGFLHFLEHDVGHSLTFRARYLLGGTALSSGLGAAASMIGNPPSSSLQIL